MVWRDFFVYGRRSARESTTGAVMAADTAAGGAFITPQTLTSFAGASTVIGVATRVFIALVPGADGRIVGAIAASLVGIIVFVINVSDPEAQPSTWQKWFQAVVVGAVNTLYLVAVTLGVFEAIAGTG
jgi:hypothetical protein